MTAEDTWNRLVAEAVVYPEYLGFYRDKGIAIIQRAMDEAVLEYKVAARIAGPKETPQ